MTVERAAVAGLWSTIDIVSRQVVQFIVTVILARLLLPEDFGVVALLTFFSGLSLVFIQGGLSTALIQSTETTKEEESAVFWWNLSASLVFGTLLLLLSRPVADFYGYPVLRPLMFVAAAQVVLSACGAVQTALLSRALRFADLAKAGLLATLLSGIAAVGAAAWGAGVWALAIQILTFATVNSALLWVVSDWRPVRHWRIATIRPLAGFGWWLSLSSMLEVLYTQGFALIVGKLHGARDLGFYNRGASTQFLASAVLSGVLGRVALPLFSARAAEPEALKRGLRMAIGLAMLINLPMMTGMALLSDLLITVLFGKAWLPASPILAILAWGGVIFPLHVLNLQIILAQGRARTYFRIEIIKKVIGVACVLFGSFFGIFGLAYAQLTVAVLALFVNVEPVRRSLGYGVIRQLGDCGGTIVVTAVMAGAILLLRPLLHFAPAANLAILVAVGSTIYAGVGLAFRVRSFVEATRVAKILLRGGRPIDALA